MSKRLMTILLLVSLALNAGIIGGLFVMGIFRQNHNAHHYWNPPNDRYSRDRDRSRFDDRMPEDANTRALRDSFHTIKTELMRELAKDPIDEAGIRSIIDRSITAQSDLEHALGMQLLNFRKTLSAGEAREYFQERLDRMARIQERIKDRRKPK